MERTRTRTRTQTRTQSDRHPLSCYTDPVNFFGHATVASWSGRSARFVLGAMLPDFATMANARVTAIADPEIDAGVALHHRTDAVFHRSTVFVQLCRAGAAVLRARGPGRGPSLGAAHLGIELLLDGMLVNDRAAASAYGAALACAADVGLRWSDNGARWQQIRRRLSERGVPVEYRDPHQVARRVRWALSQRPRLALADGDEHRVADWLASLRPTLAKASAPLLDELRAALADGTRS
jgi:hypothetical protein